MKRACTSTPAEREALRRLFEITQFIMFNAARVVAEGEAE